MKTTRLTSCLGRGRRLRLNRKFNFAGPRHFHVLDVDVLDLNLSIEICTQRDDVICVTQVNLINSMWSVWRRLCRLYMPTLTPTHWRAQGVHDWSTHERAWRRYRESRWLLQSTKEMSKQIRVSIVWNALYKRHSTINEQAIGLDTC